MPNLSMSTQQDQILNTQNDGYLSNAPPNTNNSSQYNGTVTNTNISNGQNNNQFNSSKTNPNMSQMNSISGSLQSKSHLLTATKSFEEQTDNENSNDTNIQLINDLKQQQNQFLQSQQYQQQIQQLQQPQQQSQQPTQSSQFQITSISRQQSMSGNSVNAKESKESRFRIVKTDSDKKNEINQNSSATNTAQQSGQTNKNDYLNNAFNQTPTMPSRGQNNATNSGGQNGKSYHRGRWHVMDFETTKLENKQAQMPAAVPVQSNNVFINNNNNAISQNQGGVQTTPKLTSIRNNSNFVDTPKNEDSTAVNYQYSNSNEKHLVNNNYEQQQNVSRVSNQQQTPQSVPSHQQQQQQHHNQQHTHFNPIKNTQQQVYMEANGQQASSNVILNPKPTIPATNNNNNNNSNNNSNQANNSNQNTNNMNAIQNGGQFQVINQQQQQQQQHQKQQQQQAEYSKTLQKQPTLNGNLNQIQNQSDTISQNMHQSMVNLQNALINPTQTHETIQQSSSSNNSRSNSIPNGNLSYPLLNQQQQQQQQNVDSNTINSQQQQHTNDGQSKAPNPAYTKQIFKEDLANLANQQGTIQQTSSPSSTPSQQPGQPQNFIPSTSMTTSLPPGNKILGVNNAQISNSITNLDSINTTNLNYPTDTTDYKPQQDSSNLNINVSNNSNNFASQQASPKEQKQQHASQGQNNIQASNPNAVNLSASMRSNSISNLTQSGSASSSASTILDQTTATINELMGNDETDSDDKKSIDDKGIKSRIELAMDLVKEHLSSAVNHEIEFLKNQIKQLTEKCNRLEKDNQLLKKHATSDTLDLLQESRSETRTQSVSNVNASTANQAHITNSQHAKMTSDVRVPTNAEISNLLIPSSKDIQQQQHQHQQQPSDHNTNIQRANTMQQLEQPKQDPMISSFTEHNAGQIANDMFLMPDHQQQQQQGNYTLTTQIHTDLPSMSTNIQNSDNTNMLNLNIELNK